MRAASTALVVVADAGVEAKYEDLKLRRGRASHAGQSDQSARAAGQIAGRAFDPRGPLLRRSAN